MTVDLITEKGLPHSLEAERCVLGSVILENESLYSVLDSLSSEDFYSESHKVLYERFVEMITASRGVDLVLLKDELSRLGELDQVGGITYIASLIDSVPTARNIGHYAQIIKEKATLRRLILAGYEIIDSCYKQEEDTPEILHQAERKIFAIAEDRVKTGFHSLQELAEPTWNRINFLHENRGALTGLASGFPDLDDKTLGFQPAELIIIGGRPSMGKTAFALNIAQHVGTKLSKAVGIFSLEMSKEQLMLRLVCSQAEVNAHRLGAGEFSREDWSKLMKAMQVLGEAKIYIDDSSGLTPLDMAAKARRLKAEHGLDMVIVDYLQLMRMKGRWDNRQQEISQISRSLKEMAKELHIPVIALSQLHRGLEGRGSKKPELSDLRESGSIEQDADVVMFVYREEVYERTRENAGLAEILIKKQRNGPSPEEIPMIFQSQFTRFVSKSREY